MHTKTEVRGIKNLISIPLVCGPNVVAYTFQSVQVAVGLQAPLLLHALFKGGLIPFPFALANWPLPLACLVL